MKHVRVGLLIALSLGSALAARAQVAELRSSAAILPPPIPDAVPATAPAGAVVIGLRP